MNIYAKFQFNPLMGSEEMIFNIFLKFSLLVAMATNQIQRFG